NFVFAFNPLLSPFLRGTSTPPSDAASKEVDAGTKSTDNGNTEKATEPEAKLVVQDTIEASETEISSYNPSDVGGSAVNSPGKSNMDRSRGSQSGGGRRNNRSLSAGGYSGGYSGVTSSSTRHADFPLRILVQSDMVGAIIGRQGSTIRNVTQQTRARVDVHRKDNIGSLEKAITIYGNPENCTNACKKILEVMQQEANNTNKGEVCLKILAHNNLIGRIIGKAGNTIKKIMQDTDTKITVSSINDINSFNVERIITVKGTIENMSRAEAQISARLKQSYENDMQVMSPQNMLFPGLHPMGMLSMGSGLAYPAAGRPPSYQQAPLYPAGPAPPTSYPPIYTPTPSLVTPFSSTSDLQETTYLYIPNSTVGAIIGTKGSTIRNMIRFSGASIKIAPLEEDNKDNSSVQPTDRKVTIIGTAESQWKVSPDYNE
ncbi:hypothetical protein WDU94_009066, partial [Cyamophila willieti]